MEIKTTKEVIDECEEEIYDHIKEAKEFQDYFTENDEYSIKFQVMKKKWNAVKDMIKELQKYHSGLHPECNICRLIKALSETTQKSKK